MSNEPALQYMKLLIDHHKQEVKEDADLMEFVILKTVALGVLAFDLPATNSDAGPDYEDALAKLQIALKGLNRL